MERHPSPQHDVEEIGQEAGDEWAAQHGQTRSIARQESLKHLGRQHPKRDAPRIDGEPEFLPGSSPRGATDTP
ncbi:MAG: hypothetical protein M0037_03365 [Betaproteobacteria bacterium]|nr:hypothetical protein [Betaproteobacteria bacterium]